MNERLLQNFENAGFLLPERLEDGSEISVVIGGKEQEVNVIFNSNHSEHGNLHLPIHPHKRRLLMKDVFSTMGG